MSRRRSVELRLPAAGSIGSVRRSPGGFGFVWYVVADRNGHTDFNGLLVVSRQLADLEASGTVTQPGSTSGTISHHHGNPWRRAYCLACQPKCRPVVRSLFVGSQWILSSMTMVPLKIRSTCPPVSLSAHRFRIATRRGNGRVRRQGQSRHHGADRRARLQPQAASVSISRS